MHDITQTFFDFVRIPSPTGEELQFSNYLKGRLKALGFSVYQDDRGNLITSFGTEGEPILLASHIDTVQGDTTIEPVLENGLCTSAGDTILGADNKATVAILFHLAKWAANHDKPLRKTELLFSVAEEAGISGIETLDISQISAKKGICFDASFPLRTFILSSPFYVSIQLAFHGISADASTAHRGQSVLPSLSQFLERMPQGVVEEGTFINFGAVHGGSVANALLSEVSLKGEIRCFDKEIMERYMEQINTLAQEAAEANNCTTTVNMVIENSGYSVDQQQPLVKEIAESWNAIDPTIEMNYIEQYWGISDANNLNGRGVQTVNLGYGVEDAHTPRERVFESDIVQLFEMVQHIVS